MLKGIPLIAVQGMFRAVYKRYPSDEWYQKILETGRVLELSGGIRRTVWSTDWTP